MTTVRKIAETSSETNNGWQRQSAGLSILDCSPGIVVIEGAPGTDRTAAVLRRVAGLSHAARGRAVLAIGLGTPFRSLGGTDATLGELFPGVRTAVEDPPVARRIKGSLDMIDVLAAAVADRQRVPNEPIPITLADVGITVDAAVARAARHRARATGRPHNVARAVFADELLDGLAGRAVDRIGDGWLGRGDVALRAHLAANVRRELAAHEKVPAVVDELWPRLTPQRMLADLLGSRERLAAVTADVGALYRAAGDAWTISDVPLLDEAAYLLDDRDPADPGRTYDHVVVDEAQELSEMDWRSVVRRCPARSMTIAGDLTRRRSPAGARSWTAMLDRYTAGRPAALSGPFDQAGQPAVLSGSLDQAGRSAVPPGPGRQAVLSGPLDQAGRPAVSSGPLDRAGQPAVLSESLDRAGQPAVSSGSFDQVADQVRAGVGVTGTVPSHVDLR